MSKSDSWEHKAAKWTRLQWEINPSKGEMEHTNYFYFVRTQKEEATAIKVGRKKTAKILTNSLRPSVG